VAVEQLSPSVVVWGRVVIGAALLLPIAIRQGYLQAVLPKWRIVVVFTCIEIAIPWLLLSDAERHLTSSFAGLLIATTPLLVAILAASTGREQITGSRALGLAVGLAGVAALLGLDLGGQLRAGLEMGVVIVCYAFGAMMIDRYFTGIPTLGVMSVAFTIATVVYSVIVPFSWPTHVPSTRVMASVVGLGVLCTVAAFLVFFDLVAEVGATRASVVTFVNPAVAVGLGIALRGEPFTRGVAVGFPLVLFGCWLATRHRQEADVEGVLAVAEP
jgi:drug/metabolite transporter (DMT)-like permease